MIHRLFTLARCAVHAVRSRVEWTARLGSRYPRGARVVALTALGLHFQADYDGVMLLRANSVTDGDCDHADDPDGPTSESWVVTPDQVRSWLELIEDGRTANDVMTELELADVEDAVTG